VVVSVMERFLVGSAALRGLVWRHTDPDHRN